MGITRVGVRLEPAATWLSLNIIPVVLKERPSGPYGLVPMSLVL